MCIQRHYHISRDTIAPHYPVDHNTMFGSLIWIMMKAFNLVSRINCIYSLLSGALVMYAGTVVMDLTPAAPEVVQVTSEASVEAGCANHPLCVIAFLPHILDCDANCRNGHIEDMTKLGDKYKKKDWGWLWSEGMAQPDLEAAVEVGGFGYPAMVVLR